MCISPPLVFGGESKRLLQMGLEGKFRLFISDEIFAETLRVLRDKFGFEPDDRLPKAESYIKRCTERVVPAVKLEVVTADPDDNKIVECATHSRSEAIITRDKDLLRIKSYDGIRIMKVYEFLRERPEQGR